MGQRMRDPAVLLQIALGLAIAVGFSWGLPGSDSWMADSISPRSCGLGAIVETYLPGHYHKYPPLHMALLSVLSLPWIGLAASRVGAGIDALGAELIKPLYMTGIEVSARLVAAAMAIFALRFTMEHWGRLAGPRARLAAGAAVASNAIFVLYAHTGNTDVPYLFWLTWAMLELDRVACGEPRETRALLLATAAVLTKDQAAAALILTLPAYLVLVPWLARREPVARRALVRGTLLSLALYAVVSGAAVNPVGFRSRIAHLLGPASQGWTEYPKGLGGALAMTRDALHRVTDFTSWPIVLAALSGLVVAVARGPGLARARALLPLVATVSFAYFFTLPVRQSEHRYFLPETVFFLPYAGVAFAAAWERWPRARRPIALVAALSLAPAILGVASMDATLLVDSRYLAEGILARLSPGTPVEIYGGPIFMPRIPAQLVATRPGIEPIDERQTIPGVTDLVDPEMDPRPRAPDVIVLATELSNDAATAPTAWKTLPETMQYRDPVSHEFLRKLADGSLGYRRVLRATCSLPFPLECRRIHHSTGEEVWIYARSPDGAARMEAGTAAPGIVAAPDAGTQARAGSFAPDAGSESPLHLVAEGWEGGPEMGSQFTLCPVDGAVFACGGDRPTILRDEGFVIDPSLAVGLPGDRFVYRMVGRWPEATWLVYASVGMGNWEFAVYRWRATRWVRVLDVPQGSVALGVQTIAWRGGAFARVTDSFDFPSHPRMVRLDGTGPLPAFASSPQGTNRAECRPGIGLLPEARLVSTAGGDLYAFGPACPSSLDPVVERWTQGRQPEVVHVPAHGCSVPDVTPVGAGLAAYGWCGEPDHETPFVTVFDGASWVEVDPPRMTGRARDYARNDDSEWLIVAGRPGHDDNVLLRRRPGTDWQTVALGPSAFAGRPAGTGVASAIFYEDPRHIEPMSVQTVEGETWVTGRALRADGGLGDAAAVLRMRPVEHVLHGP